MKGCCFIKKLPATKSLQICAGGGITLFLGRMPFGTFEASQGTSEVLWSDGTRWHQWENPPNLTSRKVKGYVTQEAFEVNDVQNLSSSSCNALTVSDSTCSPTNTTSASNQAHNNAPMYCDMLLALFIVIDMCNIDSHVSIDRPLCSHLAADVFVRRVLPLLGVLCNHNINNIRLSASCWNTYGLLGSNTLVHSTTHALKHEGVQRLLSNNNIVGLIETHADWLECDAFSRRWSHSHVCFWNCSVERNCGGVAVCVSRAFLATCKLCFSINIVPGRVLAVLMIFPTVNILFVCIHSSPNWSHWERASYFKRIHDCVPDAIRVTTIICGDVNFSHDTIRFNNLRPDSSIFAAHRAVASLWERHFSRFIEIAHDCPTV